ncbi:MAG: uridine kinase [Alphaproteobacteria bacterium]
MSSFVTGDGRTHMPSGLMRESLVSKTLIAATEGGRVRPMVPGVKFIAIGGQSIMDRGALVLLPLVEAIAALAKRHKMVIGVSGGSRSRHTLAIGLDLGLPIGGLARIVGSIEEQNRNILQFLLAPHGGITFIKEHFQDLSMFLAGGLIPVCIGQPPYHFWEPPPEQGRLPENGADVGLFLMAELIGAEHMVFVKDVDGVYDADPRKHPGARRMAEVTAAELLAMNLPDLPVERELLHCIERSRLLDRCRLIDGREPALLARSLDGEAVGTLIRASTRGRP